MTIRTQIVLDKALVNEALKYAGVRTKNDLIALALREFVDQHKRADVRDLRGKGLIDPTYDHRAARRGK